jgi:hypothetical protein
VNKDDIIIPCGSGDYMLQYRSIPLKTSLLQQRNLDMQIYMFLQKKALWLNKGEKYIPLVKGCNKTSLFNDFKNEFNNIEDREHFGELLKKEKCVGKTTFLTRLKELDTEFGLVIEKHGDVGGYKDISYFWIKVDDFIGYNWIPEDTGKTLIGIGSDYIIKVYGQLLAWYKMKPDWTFTYKSLNAAVGYSTASCGNDKTRAALDVLGGLGLITYSTGRTLINNKSSEVLELVYVGVEIKRTWIVQKKFIGGMIG